MTTETAQALLALCAIFFALAFCVGVVQLIYLHSIQARQETLVQWVGELHAKWDEAFGEDGE